MNFEYRILNQMTHMRRLLFISFLFISIFSFSQDDVTYKTPPKEIVDLVMAKPTPGVNVDSKGEWMILPYYLRSPREWALPSPGQNTA